ncbi:MAG: TRAP transporter small permease [SAR116 cluster bacterium]|nr:MAG: TRAP transporter small permease [SAR116 cluster bacterium]HBQ22432.1 TRAP transporter small permease [Alphaproteobacteria bacterium]HCJ62239.1 TRAP transporter small permease [Alphaproteobacteria bacterium]|tara:strand:+ start:562 stop:1065 length:504 start_codon:yes stop_codon:yes gene_type:complete
MILDRIFQACGALSAFFLVGICVLVLAQIIARLMGAMIPSADEFAGYCLSASSFLALGYALRCDAHIRVKIVLDRLGHQWRRPIEMCVVLAGFAISSLLTYSTIEMVHFSIVFNDMTQGLIPIPLWIPQMGMLLGVTMLSFAFLLDAITLWRGGTPSYMRDKTGGTS